MGQRTFISSLIITGLAGVYRITNPKNGKIYIGSAVDIRARWHKHVSVSLKEDDKLPFINALRKYGAKSFVWEVVEEVDVSTVSRKEARELLMEAEQRWLNSEQPFWFNGNGYNHNPTAYSNLGSKRTGKSAAGVKRAPQTGKAAKGVLKSGKNITGTRNSKAIWFKATDPKGQTFTRINLTQFCLKRGLNKGAMGAIARGTYISGGKLSKIYKGWTIEYL